MDINKAWLDCKNILSNEVEPAKFNTWIKPLKLEVDRGALFLFASNRFARDWVNEHYSKRILSILKEFCGDSSIKVFYKIVGEKVAGQCVSVDKVLKVDKFAVAERLAKDKSRVLEILDNVQASEMCLYFSEVVLANEFRFWLPYIDNENSCVTLGWRVECEDDFLIFNIEINFTNNSNDCDADLYEDDEDLLRDYLNAHLPKMLDTLLIKANLMEDFLSIFRNFFEGEDKSLISDSVCDVLEYFSGDSQVHFSGDFCRVDNE